MQTDTNHPALRSWVPVPPGSPFPIQNLPYGVFRPRSGGRPRIGVAIGEHVLDLHAVEEAGLLDAALLRAAGVFLQPNLNALLAAGPAVWQRARVALSRLLREDEPALRDRECLRAEAVLPQDEVEMLLPIAAGDFTDFYVSRDHARRAGELFRPERPLLPNWTWLPVAYHGRASTLVASGTPIRRPQGPSRPDPTAEPVFGPTQALDFELELGAIVGPGNRLGEPIPLAEAEAHVFGLVLLNDWSARDVQQWEAQPLGPFLGKNFATTLSPWVVPLAALGPYRCPAPPPEHPPPEYLRAPPGAPGPNFDLHLEARLWPAGAPAPTTIVRTHARHLYWSLAQMVAHHTVNGCALRPGDVLGTGTVSGPEPESAACLLELTRGGREPLLLAEGGGERRYLADGDTVILTGWAEGPGYRIGFGECRGTIVPAAPG
jgi:fumarylacetoacetase